VPGSFNNAPPTKTPFGTVDGQQVSLFTLVNKQGLILKVTNYGTIVVQLQVPDRTGKLADIVLGFDSVEEYVKQSPYFGATAGRVANRIGNARFTLNGRTYQLAANEAPHHLHGGNKGWDKVVWAAEPIATEHGPALTLRYHSPDGEEGYPGNVTATTTYTLTNSNELRVDMMATTDATTVVNMVHHTYWNLGGFNSGTIRDHELKIHAARYTPGASNGLPDGTIKSVQGTPFDFTTSKPIGRDLEAVGGTPVGFDHNWVVDGEPDALRPVAVLKDPKSGRIMTLEADQPGVQFYSGKFLDGSLKGKGARYAQYDGLCLETQRHPNSVNIPAWKSAVVLEPGKTYSHTMIHRFSVE
jgi:aldose 1-epimerase